MKDIQKRIEAAERELAEAKALPGKNAVVLMEQILPWHQLDKLMAITRELTQLASDYNLSTAFLYQMLSLADMAGASRGEHAVPAASLWRSKLAYKIKRYAEQNKKVIGDTGMQTLMQWFEKCLREQGRSFRIPLTLHLYQMRDSQ